MVVIVEYVLPPVSFLKILYKLFLDTCQSEIANAFQGYCCSASYLCPNKVEFFLDETSRMPRSCTVGTFITCPSGFTCQSTQSEFTTGFCCRGDYVSNSSKFLIILIIDGSFGFQIKFLFNQ